MQRMLRLGKHFVWLKGVLNGGLAYPQKCQNAMIFVFNKNKMFISSVYLRHTMGLFIVLRVSDFLFPRNQLDGDLPDDSLIVPATY